MSIFTGMAQFIHLHTTFVLPFLAQVVLRYFLPQFPHTTKPVSAYLLLYLDFFDTFLSDTGVRLFRLASST